MCVERGSEAVCVLGGGGGGYLNLLTDNTGKFYVEIAKCFILC